MLTHGHEDHIGAVPYLLRERPDLPLVGSKLTLALLEAKLREHRQTRSPKHQVKEGDRISFGPFDLEFIAVNHSIPDALAVAVRTGAGMLLHTGDFKMDQLPLDGRITDLRALRAARRGGCRPVPRRLDQRRGTRLHHGREGHRAGARAGLPHSAPAHHRGLLRLPRAPGPAGHGRGRARRAARSRYVGRSMVRNMGIARDLGYLRVPPDTLVDMRELGKYAPDEVVIISTGSQGEPLSALARIAHRNHDRIHIEPGDTVVLASSLIPGNENSVYRVINGLTRLGRTSSTRANAMVHVSGPRERRRAALLLQHRPAAQRDARTRRGPPPGRQRRPRGADRRARLIGSWSPRTASSSTSSTRSRGSAGKVECGYVFVDGSSVGDITESDLKDRRILGEEGFISRHGRDGLGRRQDRRRPRDPRARLRRGRERLPRGPAADRGGARGGRSTTATTTRTSCSR